MRQPRSVISMRGIDFDRMQCGRLRVAQREEHGTAKTAGDGRHEQLGDGMDGGRQERRENRPEDEHDLVDGGFQRVRGVEQRSPARAVKHVRPAGAHERAERELREPHGHGQHEQQRDGDAQQGREGESQHGDDLHRQHLRTDAALPEAVEQPCIERRDHRGGEHVRRAHHAGDRPVVVQVIQRQGDAESHHRHRQSGERAGETERLGTRNAEQRRIRRAACVGNCGCVVRSHDVSLLNFRCVRHVRPPTHAARG